MGTTTYHKPKGVSAIESIKAEALGAEWIAKHFVAATATREAVFVVGRYHEPESNTYVPDAEGYVKTLLVFKLSLAPRSYFNFGYKDMTETMGPYGCEAPLSILAQCSELKPAPAVWPTEFSSLKSAHEYRARCKAAAENKAAKRSLKPGDTVILKEALSFGGEKHQRFTVEQARVRGRRARLSTVFRASNGLLCGISARNLGGATVIKGGA